MEELKPSTTNRPWGNFRQFTHNSLSTVKIITVNAGEELSLQSHSKRTEFWKVIGGSGILQIGEQKHEVKMGDEYVVPVQAKHRMAGGENGLVVLEIDTGNFDEEDIIRYEDKYGRV